MTDEELAAIRAEIAVYQTHNGAQGDHLILHYIPALLAEVERLRAALEREQTEHANCEQFHHDGSMAKTHVMVLLAEQNAAMREIVQAVARGGTTDSLDDRIRYRLHYVVYASDEMREQARALLASEEEQP